MISFQCIWNEALCGFNVLYISNRAQNAVPTTATTITSTSPLPKNKYQVKKYYLSLSRSSRSQCSSIWVFLEISQISYGNTCVGRDSNTCFRVKCANFLRTPHFTEHLRWVAAAVFFVFWEPCPLVWSLIPLFSIFDTFTNWLLVTKPCIGMFHCWELLGNIFSIFRRNSWQCIVLVDFKFDIDFLSISETYCSWFYKMHFTKATDVWYSIVFYPARYDTLKFSDSFQKSGKWKDALHILPQQF